MTKEPFENKHWYTLSKDKPGKCDDIGDLRTYLEQKTKHSDEQVEYILHASKILSEKESHTGDVLISVRMKNDDEQYVSTYNPIEYYFKPSNYALLKIGRDNESAKIIESEKTGIPLALGAHTMMFGHNCFSVGENTEHFFENMQEFCFGSLRGHISLCRGIFAVHYIINIKPHNGDFKDFIDTMEKAAELISVDLVFMEIINPKFASYLIKRGYGNYAISGVFGLGKCFHEETKEWMNKRYDALADAEMQWVMKNGGPKNPKLFNSLGKFMSGIDFDYENIENNPKELLEILSTWASEAFYGEKQAPSAFIYGKSEAQ